MSNNWNWANFEQLALVKFRTTGAHPKKGEIITNHHESTVHGGMAILWNKLRSRVGDGDEEGGAVHRVVSSLPL